MIAGLTISGAKRARAPFCEECENWLDDDPTHCTFHGLDPKSLSRVQNADAVESLVSVARKLTEEEATGSPELKFEIRECREHPDTVYLEVSKTERTVNKKGEEQEKTKKLHGWVAANGEHSAALKDLWEIRGS